MSKKTKIDPFELALFHEAMKGSKKLSHNKVRLAHKTTHAVRKVTEEKDELMLTEFGTFDDVHGEEFITYHQSSISNKILRKLKKGQYNVEAILDLHGKNVAQARNDVSHFLQESLDRGIRVVLIIHGKGQHSKVPILKNKLNHWLRQTNFVLAFCSAAATHGSRGALYVLLKRVSP